MFSHDVKMSRTTAARFPDRCVVCGQVQPAHRTRIRHVVARWWYFFVPIMHLLSQFDGHVVHVPACAGCGWRIGLQRWWRIAVLVCLAVLVVWFGTDLVALLPRPFRKWALMGLALAALLPWSIWEAMAPLPFAMTVTADEVTYEFRDRRYAGEFALLNLENVVQMDEAVFEAMSDRMQTEHGWSDAVGADNPYRELEDPRFPS